MNQDEIDLQKLAHKVAQAMQLNEGDSRRRNERIANTVMAQLPAQPRQAVSKMRPLFLPYTKWACAAAACVVFTTACVWTSLTSTSPVRLARVSSASHTIDVSKVVLGTGRHTQPATLTAGGGSVRIGMN